MADLRNRTLFELSEMLTAGDVTSVELVQYYIQQIERHNAIPRRLNAIRALNKNIISEALALDQERKISGPRGPLHGLPILIKDNIDTSQMPTTGGSVALAKNRPSKDAFVIRELRRHGALILGKTNLSEFAHFKSLIEPSGYSSLGGQVRNPFDPDLSPSGSSSGSAVAVSADFTAAALGTETQGSIVMPARNNQVIGLKPTFGLISRSGTIPISNTQDTIGPITKSVLDAALMLDGMIGLDPEDASTMSSMKPEGSYFELAQQEAPEITIAQYVNVKNPLNTAATQLAAEVLVNAGQNMVSSTFPTNVDEMFRREPAFMRVLLAEFQVGINRYLSEHETDVHDLAEIITFNEQNKGQRYGQDLLREANLLENDLSVDSYQEALTLVKHLSRNEGLDALFADAGTDILLTGEETAVNLAAVAGYPSISIPTGFMNGFPTSVFLIGRPYTEVQLLVIGQIIEAGLPTRPMPF